jgi:hypothetical protein
MCSFCADAVDSTAFPGPALAATVLFTAPSPSERLNRKTSDRPPLVYPWCRNSGCLPKSSREQHWPPTLASIGFSSGITAQGLTQMSHLSDVSRPRRSVPVWVVICGSLLLLSLGLFSGFSVPSNTLERSPNPSSPIGSPVPSFTATSALTSRSMQPGGPSSEAMPEPACTTQYAASLECMPSHFEVRGAMFGGPPVGSAPVASSQTGKEVKPPLKITSFAASNATMDLGMSTVFTTEISGGTGPFTFQYLSLPTGCSSQNSSVLRCVPLGEGSFDVQVIVSDVAKMNATANRTVTVSPALSTPILTSNRTSVTVGISFTLTVDVSGGSSPLTFAYYGLPSNCLSMDRTHLPCIAGSQGNYSIRVDVTDGAGAVAINSTLVKVNAYPAVTIVATPSEIPLGSTLELKATATGGTPPLVYSWLRLPGGCLPPGDTANLTCEPNSTGTFTVSVAVTDVFGATVKVTTSVTVQAPVSSASSMILGVPWWDWAVALVAVASIVGVALFLFFQLRSRPAEPEKGPVPDRDTPVTTDSARQEHDPPSSN